jgi:anti-anti-sigma regulatory factor
MDPNQRSGVVVVHDLAAPAARVVELRGEHDLATLPAVREALLHVRSLVVDLSEATFIDSSVIGALMHAGQHARLVIVSPAGTRPRNVLDFVRAGDIVAVVESRATALEAIGGAERGD